ncbi:MAG: hypothetical protein NZ108_07935, partial [Bacteroidia bacterium]|nr:hypothetical protein [Bacteroidia bacterium]
LTGDSIRFIVSFNDVTTPGFSFATVNVVSNDLDEATYNFDIQAFVYIVNNIQATSLVSSGITNTSATISFSPGNGTHRIVVVSQEAPVSFVPTNGVIPSGINSDFAIADNHSITGIEKVVYNGSGSSVTVTNLTPGVDYYFRVYEYCNHTLTYQISTSGNNNSSFQVTTTPDMVVFPSTLIGNVNIQSYTFSFLQNSFPISSTITLTSSSSQFLLSEDGTTYSQSIAVTSEDNGSYMGTIFIRFQPTQFGNHLDSISIIGLTLTSKLYVKGMGVSDFVVDQDWSNQTDVDNDLTPLGFSPGSYTFGTTAYNSLSAALTAASIGMSIKVFKSTANYPSVTISTNNLTLVGDYADSTYGASTNAPVMSAPGLVCITLDLNTASELKIYGFQFKNANGAVGELAGPNYIQNFQFKHNSVEDVVRGVSFSKVANTQIEWNDISTINGTEFGIDIAKSAAPFLVSTIRDNKVSGGLGIRVNFGTFNPTGDFSLIDGNIIHCTAVNVSQKAFGLYLNGLNSKVRVGSFSNPNVITVDNLIPSTQAYGVAITNVKDSVTYQADTIRVKNYASGILLVKNDDLPYDLRLFRLHVSYINKRPTSPPPAIGHSVGIL